MRTQPGRAPAGPADPAAPAGAADPTGRYALAGRVVTMDAAGTVLDPGVVFIAGNRIAAVAPAAAPPPDFADVRPRPMRGTIYPGLIELHNHLSYDALRLWDVPATYQNRSQWRAAPSYVQAVTGPMCVLGQSPGYPEAIVRYV